MLVYILNFLSVLLQGHLYILPYDTGGGSDWGQWDAAGQVVPLINSMKNHIYPPRIRALPGHFCVT